MWWTDEKKRLRFEAENLRISVNGAMELILGAVGRAIVQREQRELWHRLSLHGCATWIQAHVRGRQMREQRAREVWAASLIQKIQRGRQMRAQMRLHKPGRGRHRLPRPDEAQHLVPSGAKVLMRRVTGGEAEAGLGKGGVMHQDEGPTVQGVKPDARGRAFRAELSRCCQVVCDSCSEEPDEALDKALEWLCACLSVPEPKPESPTKRRPATAAPATQQRPSTAAPVVQRVGGRPSTAEPASRSNGMKSGRPATAAPKVRQAGALSRPSTAGPVKGLAAAEPARQKAPRSHDDEIARRAKDIVDSGVAGWLVYLLKLRGPPEKLSTEALFKEVDIDGDGRISQEEAWQYMRSKDPTLDEAYVTKIWDTLDEDGNGTLDITEFPAFLEAATMLTPEEANVRDNMYDRPLAAAWLVSNLAAVSPAQTAELCACAGGGESLIYALLAHVRGDHADRAEQAVWALANLAAAGVELRDHLLDAGGVPVFIAHLNAAAARGAEFAALYGVYIAGDLWPPHWSRRAAVGLATLCGGGDPQPEWELTSSTLPLWAKLLTMIDEHVVATAMRALASLSEGSLERLRAVTDTEGLVEQVGELMRAVVNTTTAASDEERARASVSHKGAHPVLTGALVIVRNVCTANCLSVACADSCVQCVLDADILPLLLHQLYHDDTYVRACACAIVANILAGSNSQIDAVLHVDQTSATISIGRFIPKFLDLVCIPTEMPELEAECYRKPGEKPDELDWRGLGIVRLEAAWGLANFSGASYEARCALLDEDGLAMLGMALVVTAETATTWFMPVPPQRLPGDEEVETAREALEPLLITIENALRGRAERDAITQKATRRKRPKSALTVGGVAVSMEAEVPSWVAEEQREAEEKLMAPTIQGCKQLLLLPDGTPEREMSTQIMVQHFTFSEEQLDQEEAELRALPVVEEPVKKVDPVLSVADKLFCCRQYDQAPQDNFSALKKQGQTLKHTFNSMYLFVAEKSDLNSRDECIWCEPRAGGEGGPADLDSGASDTNLNLIGKLTYNRVLNPRTGITNEHWENRGGLKLIDAVLSVLEEDNSAAKWTEVCQALAAPKLALCYADAAIDGVKVKETRPAPPPSVLSGFDTPGSTSLSPAASLGRPSTAASRRMRLASRAYCAMLCCAVLRCDLPSPV